VSGPEKARSFACDVCGRVMPDYRVRELADGTVTCDLHAEPRRLTVAEQGVLHRALRCSVTIIGAKPKRK